MPKQSQSLKLSYYKSDRSYKPRQIEFDDTLKVLVSDAANEQITTLRKLEYGSKPYTTAKQKLPFFMWSAVMNDGKKVKANVEQFTNLLCIDLDDVDDVAALKKSLGNDPYALLTFVSPSGKGLKVILQVPGEREDLPFIFLAARNYFKQRFGITPDEKCKNINRYCYISYDPDFIYNKTAKPFDWVAHTLSTLIRFTEKKEPYPSKIVDGKRANNRNNHIFCLAVNCRNAGLPMETVKPYFSEIFVDYSENDSEEQLLRTIESAYTGDPSKKVGDLKQWFEKQYKSFGYRNTKKDDTLRKTPPKETIPADTTENDGLDHKKPTGNVVQVNDLRLWESNGCYYYEEGRKAARQLTNFTIETLYHLKFEGEPKVILRFTNHKTGFSEMVSTTLDDFSSASKLKRLALNAGSGQFFYYGTDKGQELTLLHQLIFKGHKVANTVEVLGYQPDYDVFAFGNGIVNNEGKFFPCDDFGVVQEAQDEKGNMIFIPGTSKLLNNQEKKEYRYQSDYTYYDAPDKQRFTFSGWTSKMIEFYGEKAYLGAAFIIASFFSDIIYQKTDRFPLWFSYGKPKTGKSSFNESLLAVFGSPRIINLGTKPTPVGILRSLNQYCNGLLGINEYDNSVDEKIDKLFKGIYDRESQVSGIKSTDVRTNVFDILSAVMMAGEEMPVFNSALFSRILLEEFGKSEFDRNTQQALEEFKEDHEKKGFSYLVTELMPHRELIASHYREDSEKIREHHLSALEGKGVDNRFINNYVSILTPLYTLLVRGGFKFPVTFQEVAMLAVNRIIKQKEVDKTLNPVDVFFDSFQRLYETGIVKNRVHFKMMAEGIAIRYRSTYPLFAEFYYKKYRKLPLPEPTLEDYLKNHPAFIKFGNEKDGYKYTKHVRFVNIDAKGEPIGDSTTTAYMFNFQKLGIELSDDVVTQKEVKE